MSDEKDIPNKGIQERERERQSLTYRHDTKMDNETLLQLTIMELFTRVLLNRFFSYNLNLKYFTKYILYKVICPPRN